MGEHGGDVVALRAFNVEEVAVRCLNKFLKFVHMFFCDWVSIQKVHFHFVYDFVSKYLIIIVPFPTLLN